MTVAAGRIRAFDWLKGLAVVVMVQTHTIALLRPELMGSPLHQRLNWIDGLVAPSFILTSGFALALVQVRGAASGGQVRRALKSLRRIGEVLLVAVYMISLWFPITLEPKWLLRIDILPCIGLSLLAALPVFVGLARWPRLLSAVCAAIGLGIIVGTPAVWATAGGLARQLMTNTRTDIGSPFPLFPWAGYVFLGGALGAVAARSSAKILALSTVALAAVGGAIWLFAARMMEGSAWPWWAAANHAQRVVVVSGLILAMLAAERLLPASVQRGWVVRFFEVFGTSSLAAYFGHEVMLFKNVFGVCFNTLWGKSAGWPLYWALTAALIGLTFVFTWAVAQVYDHGREWLRAGISRLRSGSPKPPSLSQP
ncbi:MAG: heparan-alpha-glucosaminide N-acetyltransferase domain-containing protein [Myxococcales bacterium]